MILSKILFHIIIYYLDETFFWLSHLLNRIIPKFFAWKKNILFLYRR